MQLNSPRRARGQAGFTLVELMIAVTVMSILLLAAAPSLRQWIFNTRVRTAAEALQNGLRLAQGEAVRQGRQVVFGLTGAQAGPPAHWVNWSVERLPNALEATNEVLRTGPGTDVTGGVQIATAPANRPAVCFSSLGNLVLNTGASCTAAAVTYTVSHPSGDRPLSVQLSLGGRVRMCDPGRPANTPDGC